MEGIMTMKVKLEHIIEGMEMQSEENRSYLNRSTGEIVYVSHEALLIAEDGEEYEHLAQWQREEVETAIDIVESFGKYVELPSQLDINEYEMIESFCYRVSDVNLQNVLLNSIRGRGAFRRFKEKVHRFGLINEWYKYRDMRYMEIAKEFCESNSIDY